MVVASLQLSVYIPHVEYDGLNFWSTYLITNKNDDINIIKETEDGEAR